MTKPSAYRDIMKMILIAGAATSATTAFAKDAPPQLNKCDASFGTVAIVEGDTQGWSKYGLGSPREVISSLAIESGCFTPHSAATGKPATFLMNVIAGDKEEVDKSVDLAKSAVTEGLVRSGAAGQLLSSVPGGGALIGMFGRFGGKKKTVAAGIRLIAPATGQTILSGTGSVRKSSLSIADIGAGVASGAASSGYAASKDGKMLIEAFIQAFNEVSAQGSVLATAAQSAPVAAIAAASPSATVQVATNMYATPVKTAKVVRALRPQTTLVPTGKRQGLFVEVADNFGTSGWVSVEDLQ